MSKTPSNRLTDPAQAFLQPKSPAHRQYEALRAYFVEKRPSSEVARQFGYTPGSFRVLCSDFRRDVSRQFFVDAQPGPKEAPKSDRVRDRVIALRKTNLSIYDISRSLAHDGERLSPAAVALILNQEGFARLPRRSDDERPERPRPERAGRADVRELDLSERTFRTQFGGLFLFFPWLTKVKVDHILNRAGFPGSKMVPAGCAVRSLLALKLAGKSRHSHLMAHVHDEGLALFAGLNVIPKRAFLTEYSCRIAPASYPRCMRDWFDAVGRLGLTRGASFDVDFHTIPHHGEDALIEKHYVSKRSRRQKGVLAFLAQDAETRVFCYANGEIRKQDQADEVLRFVSFWRERTGKLPEELVFDSRLTTYPNLNRLNQDGVKFITLRRRSDRMLAQAYATPPSAWRRVELKGITRQYRTPKVLDQRITLNDYDGPIRQLIIHDLGHEEPTFLLTNQMRRSAATLIGRYAQRMIIENGIADGIDFFHMDALSSAVAMKVNCDLQLTLMASSLYRLLAQRIGNGYEHAHARRLFQDLVEASATVNVGAREITVAFQKRSHNPLLFAAGYREEELRVPWLGGRRLRFNFG